MAERHFMDMLKARWQDADTLACVGLDPAIDKLPDSIRSRHTNPAEAILAFNKEIIDATHDLVCAFKPQSSYYEAFGPDGIKALKQTVEHIHKVAPTVPVILDAKRADIGSTNEGYVQALFDYLKLDAVTLQPYLGLDALAPFFALKNKGLIVLCRTSNPNSGEFQDLMPRLSAKQIKALTLGPSGTYGSNHDWSKGISLYNYVALRVANHQNQAGNCLLVVGATYPEEMKQIRQLVGDLPFLVPGIGAQGGDIEATVKAGQDSLGQGMIINSARGIIYASSGADFAQAARKETLKLKDEINKHRK